MRGETLKRVSATFLRTQKPTSPAFVLGCFHFPPHRYSMKNHWISRRQEQKIGTIYFYLKVDIKPLEEGFRKAREALSSFTSIKEVEDIIQKIEMPVMVNGIAIASFKPFADLSLKDFMETDSEDLASLCKAEIMADFSCPVTLTKVCKSETE